MKEKPRQILPGIYMVDVPCLPQLAAQDESFGTLCYLIEERDGWLMVDCGFNDDSCFESLRRQLQALGIPFKDIKWLFITQYHPDHSGLALRIQAASGAKVIIHQQDWDILQHAVSPAETWTLDGLVQWSGSLGVPPLELDRFYQMASFGRTLFPRGLEPDIVFQGEENALGGDGHLRAILTPGHSPGHMCLYDEKNKVLFSGDHVLVEITPHVSPSHLTSYNQLGQYLEALRKVRSMDAELVLPAHERPFSHLARRVDEILEHHQQRLAEVLAGLSDRPSTPWDLASKVHWDVGPWEEMDATNHVLAVRETLAHLQFLESRGQVVMEERGGLSMYKLTDVPPSGE
jgi:glyoxylase-like metal-dependent hydrolase (beta-lactamase superfamily II)